MALVQQGAAHATSLGDGDQTGTLPVTCRKPAGLGLAALTVILVLLSASVSAQQLEPRMYTNIPVGMNFFVLGYSYARGNILLDPAVPVEDLDSRLHTVFGAYVRAIDFFGLSGKVDIVVPGATADWTGKLEGEAASRSVEGFGDPRMRLSVNFYGAPALRKEEFSGYQQTG